MSEHDAEKGVGKKDVASVLADAVEVQTTGGQQWLTGFKLWSVMGSMTLACFLILLDVSILSTATPKITSTFHSLSDVGWYGAAYQLTNATLQPLTGKIYSNFRTKWTFLSFIALFEFGSLLCAVSTNSKMLIVARAIAGMGASGVQNGALTMLAGVAPMEKRPTLTGITFGVAQLGIVCGPLLGGLFTQFVSWRWCFYINLPIGAVMGICISFIHVPENAPKPPVREVLATLHHRLDLIGFAIFAPGIVLVLMALQWGGNQYAWNSGEVIGFFCGGGAILLVWLWWNTRQGWNAMMPWPLLKQQHVWSSCVYSLFSMGAGFTLSYYLPLFFQTVRGFSPILSGALILPTIGCQIIASVLSGKGVEKTGYYLPWAVAGSVLASISFGLFSTATPATSTGAWIGFQIIAGLGRGLGFQIPFLAVQNNLEGAKIPVAMSLLMFSQNFGGALSLCFADTIFTNSLRSLLRQNLPDVNPQQIVSAGAYNLRHLYHGATLVAILQAYAKSIDRVLYMCAAFATWTFAIAWFMGWIRIGQKKSKNVATNNREASVSENQ